MNDASYQTSLRNTLQGVAEDDDDDDDDDDKPQLSPLGKTGIQFNFGRVATVEVRFMSAIPLYTFGTRTFWYRVVPVMMKVAVDR